MNLREAHRERVERNELRASPLWAQPCLAYNVQIKLDPRTKASLWGDAAGALSKQSPACWCVLRRPSTCRLAWGCSPCMRAIRFPNTPFGSAT